MGTLDRTSWDTQGIRDNVQKAKPYRNQFVKVLQEKYGKFFHVRPHAYANDQYGVYITSKNPNNKARVRIALECGTKQPRWTRSVKGDLKHWRGLNILSRKLDAGKNYEILIKHSMNGASFFACTYEFPKKHGEPFEHTNNSVGFTTNDKGYALPMSVLNEDHSLEFCHDNWDELQEMIEHFLGETKNNLKRNLKQTTLNFEIYKKNASSLSSNSISKNSEI